MNARRIAIVALTLILIVAVFVGAAAALEGDQAPAVRAELANVRDYAPAADPTAGNYAVDGGALFIGEQGRWVQVPTPEEVIVSSVVADATNPDALYIGAANEMAVYRTVDGGRKWLRIPLTEEHIGGVTDIAMDPVQRIVYVGTDTAGLFRLRDVGSSVVLSGHLLIDEPVREVVADQRGQGLAFARTDWNLYRGENYGLAWVTVDNLHSTPTAVAIADTDPATVLVGTTDRGLLTSSDGIEWTLANEGLGLVPGSRLKVNAIAVDATQPEVAYVATSYIHGTTEAHEAPVGVAMSTDGAQAWSPVAGSENLAVAELLPVNGLTGGVYALTTESRTPYALGDAPVVSDVAIAEPAAQPVTDTSTSLTSMLAWIIAALAALALTFAVAMDLRSRRPEEVGPFAPRTVNSGR